MNDHADRLRLARTEGVGPVSYRRLLASHGSAAAALAAMAGETTPQRLPTADAIAREMDAVHRQGGAFLFLDEASYPALLARLDDAPPAIAVFGDLALLHAPAIGVVGSRNASANGLLTAETLGHDLAQGGLVVVSGLARGIDSSAHRGALRAGGTIACIAGGLDHPYPPENAALQAEIAQHGAVVAEAPWGTTPQARHFPRRNRIIAGLSLGVVVVEAAPRSGSLITARMAIATGRPVLAVPGSPLDPRHQGCNDLLRHGAHLVETAADVRAHLPLAAPVPAARRPPETRDSPGALATNRSKLLEMLGPSPTAVDELIRRCQLSAAVVMTILLDLEIAGRVQALPGNKVALRAEPGP